MISRTVPIQAVAVRPARPADVPALAEIESMSSPAPWSAAQLAAELEKGAARCVVLAAGERVVGFGVVWMVADEAQVANLAVHPDSRRRGLGRAALGALIGAARSSGARRVTLEVREGNAAALALYASEGFVETFRRPRFYEGRETAVLMERPL